MGVGVIIVYTVKVPDSTLLLPPSMLDVPVDIEMQSQVYSDDITNSTLENEEAPKSCIVGVSILPMKKALTRPID